MQRRKFIDLTLLGSLLGTLGSILYPIFEFMVPPKEAEATPQSVLAGAIDEMRPNSGKIFRMGNRPGILLETPEGELKAFSAVCTHLDCTVQYRADQEHIWCACHNGHYDLSGINIAGPPPRPLEVYRVNVKDGKIYVSRDEAA